MDMSTTNVPDSDTPLQATCHKEGLVSAEDRPFLWDVSYSYDYMSGCPDPSSLSPNIYLISPNIVAKDGNGNDDIPPAVSLNNDSRFLVPRPSPKTLVNSIPLYPEKTSLPWHSSLHSVLRQSKHWQHAVAATRSLLELFTLEGSSVSESMPADSPSTFHQQLQHSYARAASAALRRIDSNWSRFSVYMTPAADRRRLELVAATLVFVFLFDDLWEMHEDETIQQIQADFVSRLKVAGSGTIQDTTPLQAFISDIVQALHDEDLKSGDGGKEVINQLINFINHPPPPKQFNTLREFLDYRMVDAAAPYVFACVKFSLESSVDIASPRIAKFMSLAADHCSLANDLGSFDKEKNAYLNKNITHLINTVDIVQKVFDLPDSNSAKSATLALQLHVEKQIAEELSVLCQSPDVTPDELEFVEAVVHMLAGIIFPSVVMCRYGGDGARMSA